VPVEWRPTALADLEAIFAYLLPLNPFAAERVVQELTVAADSLASFPHRGRPGRASGTRELVTAWPYILVYEVRQEAVFILRVWHGAQDRLQ
jgi:addiction module RelE/StbE family toxin